MKKISRMIALLLCMMSVSSITAEAQATVENKVRILEIGDGFEVYLDQAQMQRSNELVCMMSILRDEEDNQIIVSFSTMANTVEVPSEIGVRDFVLQEKGWLFWSNIYADDFCDYNEDYYSGGIAYRGPEEDKTYRAIGTHYAIIDGEEYTYIMISEEV